MPSSSPKKHTKKRRTPASLSPQKRRLFTIITAVIPLVLLIVIEIMLRLFHYGSGYDLVMTTEVDGKAYYTINPMVGKRYFNPQRYFIPQIASGNFEVVKSPNTFRVFILGESTPAGFPYQYNTTPSYVLQKQLEIVFPGKNIEIVNVGLTATNSYTVLEFIGELVDYQPDAFIIYSGQNEFYGALGVGSTISLGSERWLIRTYQEFRKLKTFVLLENILTALSTWIFGTNTATQSGTLMQQVTNDKAIPFGSDLYKKAVGAYEKNLRATLSIADENGIPVVLSTLVTNERSLPPFVSIHNESLSETQKKEVLSLLEAGEKKQAEKDYSAASELYNKIIAIDPVWAMAFFKLGECYDATGKFDSAKAGYDKARDLDGLRFRASSEFNDIVHRMASMPNVVIADIESTFRTNSPNGIIGKELLWEHVHPNLKGYILLSRTWFEALTKTKLFPYSDPGKFPHQISDSLLMEHVKITPLDVEIGTVTMSNLLHRWPFTDSSASREPVPTDDVQRVAHIFVQGKLRWSEAHYEMADAYLRNKDIAGAVKEYESVNTFYPNDPFPLMRMGDMYSLLGENEKAERAYLQSVAIRENQFARLKLGVLYLKAGLADPALEQLSTALAVNNRLRIQFTREQNEDAIFYYALALYKSHKNSEAVQVLKMLLRRDPNNAKAARLIREIQSETKN